MLSDMWARGRSWWAGRTLQAKREILIALLLLFSYGFFRQVPAWNEYSRSDEVRAIVEQGTIRIDAFHDNTGDAASYGGHWYSDKPPGSALLGVPVYIVQSAASQLVGAGMPRESDAVQALAFVESGLSTVVLVLLLIRFLGGIVGEGWATVVGLAYAFGSMAFPFATMFFGHAASTAGLFAAFYALHASKASGGAWKATLAGFLAGWAVLVEIPVVLGVVALGLYAVTIGRGAAVRFVLGGLPLAVVLMAYDWLAFGNPLSVGYQFDTVFGQQNQQGIVSIVWPSLATTGDLLFGARGLIRLAPWFALAPLGLLAVVRRELRIELIVAAAICLAFLTYNSGALNPFGGWTPGPRYLLPALPFAAILVAVIPRRVRLVAIPLMVAAVGLFFVATITMPNAPELYDDPLFDLWLPRLVAGSLADTVAMLRWGLQGLMPLAVLLSGLAVGSLALAISFLRPSLADQVTARGSILLAIIFVLFATPL